MADPRPATFRDWLALQPALPAPMCGVSDFAFRSLSRELAGPLAYTQMVSAENIARGLERDRPVADDVRGYLDVDAGEAPLAIQLFGADPEAFGPATHTLAELGVTVIDLNMGCPARKITSGYAGSALLCDLPRAERIMRAMRGATAGLVTVKMRWDWDHNEGAALEAARMAEAAGFDGVCLHARTRSQGYSGEADWDAIARLKETVSIPVVGNGDIRTPEDALAMRRATGCDGVMIGRALMGDPWLLGEANEALLTGAPVGPRRGRDWPTRRCVMLTHAGLMFARHGQRGVIQFRKHAACYLRGLRGARRLRERLVRVSSIAELEAALPLDLSEAEALAS